MLPIQRAINHVGSITELANRLGVTPQVIVNWRARKKVPPERCADIEKVTEGAVTRADLRPDIFGEQRVA